MRFLNWISSLCKVYYSSCCNMTCRKQLIYLFEVKFGNAQYLCWSIYRPVFRHYNGFPWLRPRSINFILACLRKSDSLIFKTLSVIICFFLKKKCIKITKLLKTLFIRFELRRGMTLRFIIFSLILFDEHWVQCTSSFITLTFSEIDHACGQRSRQTKYYVLLPRLARNIYY